MAKRVRKGNIIEQVSHAITLYRFRVWWEQEQPSYNDLFEMVNKVRAYTYSPLYTRAKFDEGVQYRMVRHSSYRVAREEMLNLCFGWW